MDYGDSNCLYCLKGIVTDFTGRIYFCSDKCEQLYKENREDFMPIRKIEKPTKQEVQAAQETQAPSEKIKSRKLREPEKNGSVAPTFRTLKDAHIDGNRNEFISWRAFFENDDDDISQPIAIYGARLIPNTLKPGEFNVLFTISMWKEEEKHSVTLPQDSQRDEYVAYFATNTIPLGPLEFRKIPSPDPRKKAYVAIGECSDESVVPF